MRTIFVTLNENYPTLSANHHIHCYITARLCSPLQHHHDHIFHSVGARADAAVSVDLQPGLDQHTCGQPHALRGHHPDPVQHSHPHRFGSYAEVPQHAFGRHCFKGNLRALSQHYFSTERTS